MTPQRWAAKKFRAHVHDRMLAGAKLYGDLSYHRPPHELASEITDECADIAGWGRILEARTNGGGVRLRLCILNLMARAAWTLARSLERKLEERR